MKYRYERRKQEIRRPFFAKKCLPGLKRYASFLHYPNKWKTSRSAAMSHSLGPQPGNSRLGPSKAPESTGKRLRRFVPMLSSLRRFLIYQGGSTFLKESVSSQCSPPVPARRPAVIAAVTHL